MERIFFGVVWFGGEVAAAFFELHDGFAEIVDLKRESCPSPFSLAAAVDAEGGSGDNDFTPDFHFETHDPAEHGFVKSEALLPVRCPQHVFHLFNLHAGMFGVFAEVSMGNHFQLSMTFFLFVLYFQYFLKLRKETAMKIPNQITKIEVFYDGRCGMCCSFHEWINRQPRAFEIAFVPYQAADAEEIFPGIGTLDPAREMIVRTCSEEIYRGAEAWVLCLYSCANYQAAARKLDWAGAVAGGRSCLPDTGREPTCAKQSFFQAEG